MSCRTAPSSGLEVDHSDGWTDWNTACEIVAKSAKEVGIDISTEFPQAPTAISRWQNGDFDCACNPTPA
jgi:peptide/nickel transport system substrate-binding protein